MLPLFEANCFEPPHERKNNHSSMMSKQMLGILLFVFTVYRAIDLYLDLYYWFYRVPDAFLIPACVVSCFNLWYIFQFDPNFHPVEAIVNLVQMFVANLRASSDIASGCIYSVDFYYVLCCCCRCTLLLL